MLNTVRHIIVCAFLLTTLWGCASHRSWLAYQGSTETQRSLSVKQLQENKWLNAKRNRLLFLLEAGLAARQEGNYKLSNEYLNQADDATGFDVANVKEAIVSNATNPMQNSYRPTAYEQMMVHYYKALNYAEMGLTEDALVEARRISLTNERLSQTNFFKGQTVCRAFSNNLQGMLYEMDHNMNDAFISYNEATELYNSADQNKTIQLPTQLLSDAKLAAQSAGLYFNTNLPDVSTTETFSKFGDGFLILFIEQGTAPEKRERESLISRNDQQDNFRYLSADGIFRDVNFPGDGRNNSYSGLNNLQISIPYYRPVTQSPTPVSVLTENAVYEPAIAADMNVAAYQYQQEHELQEVTGALVRYVTKKGIQVAIQEAAAGVAKATTDKSADSTSQSKDRIENNKIENAETARAIAGTVVSVLNNITERADTRNWRGLPAFVSYVRIPLHPGENKIKLSSNGVNQEFSVFYRKGIQMKALRL